MPLLHRTFVLNHFIQQTDAYDMTLYSLGHTMSNTRITPLGNDPT